MFCVYRLSDGRFVRGMASLPPMYDPATEGLWRYAVKPDFRLHRYDATVPEKVRLATAQELADFDAERVDSAALAQFDGETQKMIKALAIWMAQRLNIPLVTARAEILAIYKGL